MGGGRGDQLEGRQAGGTVRSPGSGASCPAKVRQLSRGVSLATFPARSAPHLVGRASDKSAVSRVSRPASLPPPPPPHTHL